MIGYVGWAIVIGLVLAWQGIGLIKLGDDFPSFTDILRTVTQSFVGRWLLFGLWLWMGWHWFAREWERFIRP